MKSRLLRTPNKYIMPLNVNSLRGNLYYKKNYSITSKHLLYIPDLRSDIHTNFNVLQTLSAYGSVTAIDLPGIGGMESFYKIDRKPTIENYADYLSSLIRLRYKNKNIILVGQGFGFIVLTRMLQKNPNIAKQVRLVIAIDGIARFDDLSIDKKTRIYYRFIGLLHIIAQLLVSIGLKYHFLEKGIFNRSNKKDLFQNLLSTDTKFANKSLHSNDLATHLYLLRRISMFDNCTSEQLDIPLWNIILDDSSIDKEVNEQHLRIIYKRYYQSTPKIKYYDLFVVNDKLMSSFINSKLKRLLARKR